MLQRVQAVATESHFLRGRAAVAEGSPAALEIALAQAATLDGDKVPAARGYATAIRAGVALRRGRAREATTLLADAEAVLEGCGALLYAAACRLHLAHLRDDAEGSLRAEAALRDQSVRRPERLARLLTPGPPGSPS
jgi:hypothetical protein